MRRDDPRHGTYAGVVQHRKEGKRPCKPCRDAGATYMREWRAASPDARERQYARNRAYRRALVALASLHREDYQRLYAEEIQQPEMATGKANRRVSDVESGAESGPESARTDRGLPINTVRT